MDAREVAGIIIAISPTPIMESIMMAPETSMAMAGERM